MENRRQFFRIEYPEKMGPRFVIKGLAYQVLDLSEHGIKLKALSSITFKVGEKVVGSLSFPSGESMLTFGNIRRLTVDTISIQFNQPVPYRIIMSEQRRLIQLLQKRA